VNKPAVRKMTAPPVHCLATTFALADAASRRSSPTNIFRPDSTPAQSIYGLSLFVLAITAVVFVLVFGLLAYAVIKFRERAHDDKREPPQVYGSSQVETAWTVIAMGPGMVWNSGSWFFYANAYQELGRKIALPVISWCCESKRLLSGRAR
jgi:heme/copper-type cytochrome/quinol oxidase subunit 2